MYRILVLGDGYAACTVTAYFRSKNQRVFPVVRTSETARKLFDIGAEPVTGDIRFLDFKSLPDAQFIILAPSLDEEDSASLRKLHLEDVALFMELVRKNPPPTFILYLSSVEVFGEQRGEEVEEPSRSKPVTEREKILREAENRVLDSGYHTGILRIGTLYGPGENDLERVDHKGWPGLIENRYLHFLHEEDLMQMMPIVLKRIRSREILIACDDEPVLDVDYYRWLTEKRGLVPVLQEMKGDPKGFRASNFSLKKIGYTFRYPTFRDGYTALLGESKA